MLDGTLTTQTAEALRDHFSAGRIHAAATLAAYETITSLCLEWRALRPEQRDHRLVCLEAFERHCWATTRQTAAKSPLRPLYAVWREAFTAEWLDERDGFEARYGAAQGGPW